MTKYQGRNESSTDQAAELHRRVGRLETSRGPTTYQVVTAADYGTPPLSTASTSFVTLAYLWPAGKRPGIEVYCRVLTPGGVSMELRLMNLGAGTLYSPVATVPGGTNDFQGLRGRDPSLFILACELQARVASGAGTVRVGVLKVVGGDFTSELF
jgi:hypothetical protein